LLFVAVLTVVYLILLFNDKSKGYKRRLKMTANLAMLGAYASMILLVVFQRLWDTSLFYFLLYPIAVFLFLTAVIGSSDSNKKYLLILAVLLHLVVLSIIFPSFGIRITERIPALAKLNFAKTWNPEWQMLDAYYDPFPMDLGLFYVFSEITGTSYINLQSGWIVALLFVIAYDLTLFSLTRGISGSWKVGILSILLLTFTPPTKINLQPQWFASFFILIFMLGLFKALKDRPSFSSIVLVNLSYVVAILFHGTAAIGTVVVSILLMLMYFGRRFGVNLAITTCHRSFLHVVSIFVYTVILGRWVILGGLTSVINPMRELSSIFGHGEVGWIGSQYVSLYDQFVSPINAYAWSVPVSLATAFILYHFVNHVQKKSLSILFASSMSVSAAGLAFAGFLGSIFISHANLQRYIGYASFILFIPAAAIACSKILRSFSGKVMSICLISIVLFSGIGIWDPEFSPQLYREIKTVNPARSADFIEGTILYTILSEETYVVSTYEMLSAFSYLNIISESSGKSIRFYALSLKTHRIMVENLTEEKEVVQGVTYIWTQEILSSVIEVPVNVVYDSGRHAAVRRAG